MKDERLEMLSDKVRKGVPIDFVEAIKVRLSNELQQERKTNSWVYKVRRFFGFEQ